MPTTAMSSSNPETNSTSSAAAHYHPPRKSGQLYKKTGIPRSWKARYFALEGSLLYYYKREGDTVPKGIVVLTGCKITATRDKKYYSFRISHARTSKVYDLAATLQSRTDDWIEILREAAHSAHAQGPGAALPSRSDSLDHRPSMLEATPLSSSSSSFAAVDIDHEAIAAEDVELPNEYRLELEGLMSEFVAQARDDAEGWKLQTEQRNCKVFTRQASRLGSCKGVGFINHHPYSILKLLLELSRRASFDPQLMATKRVFVYDDHTFIDHLVYKPVFPASGRDFVNITHWRVLRDGSILLVATSTDRDDLCPRKEPEFVRARTVMGGFLITPNEDYTGAYARYIIKADVKGGIPTALQTKMFIKQAFVIDGLRRALEEDDIDPYADLPHVTNETTFGLTTTELEEDHEELQSTRSFAESMDLEDDRDEATSTSAVEIPEEGLPAVPEKYRDVVDKLIARMNVDIEDISAWNFHSEKYGVKAYTKVDGSLTAAMGSGHVPYHPRAIWDVVMDVEKKKTYDAQLATGMRAAVLDAQTNVDYLEYKPVFVVAGRDFCNLVHWRVLPGGTIIVVAQSIEDLALCPLKEPKVVRGEVHIAAWKIVPDADYKGAQVTFMVKSDLKGSIPSRIASKAAAEQPYMIHQISQVLKKMKNLDEFASQGKLTNTVFSSPSSAPTTKKSRANSGSMSSVTRAKSSSSASTHAKPVKKASSTVVSTSSTTSSRKASKPEPMTEPAPKSTEVVKTKPAEQTDVMDPQDKDSKPLFFAANAGQFIAAILALKVVSLPGILHYGVVGFLLVYFAAMLLMGPCTMTPRRKLMIASFGPPDSGMILGTLSLDMTKTRQYIDEKRKLTGEHITITHVVLRALGAALARSPSVNGHIVFGNYYPAPTVDISCLVAVGGGKDLGVCKLEAADKMSLKEICTKVRGGANKLRSGKDKAQEDRNKLMSLLPTFVIRPVVNLVGWLGGCLGLRIKPVGVEPYMFGSCMVTSVGMMGLELAFAPITPYTQVPVLMTIGAIKDTPVVEDGKVVVRPILTVTTTIDHRYVDGSQAARMASYLKQCIEDPYALEPVNA